MGRIGTGVEIRKSSIRIKFVLDGQTIKERLTVNGRSLPPTPANLKYAERVSFEVNKRIALGNFQFAEFFPDSPRARETARETPQTFGALADLWLQSKGNLEAASLSQYTSAVAMWKRLLGAGTKMDKLSYQSLSAKIGSHPWASAKSLNNYLIPLRGIFEFEYTGRRAADNPMIGIKNAKLVKKLPDPLTEDERDTVLAYMTEHYDPRVTAYFSFAFFTGMRPEEIIALTWSDFDRNSGTVRIQRVRTFRGTERDGSKTHAERDVDLVSRAIDALATMENYTRPPDGEPDENAYIFENPVTGKPWHDERSQRDHYWKPALRKEGIRYRRAYCTRHTYATIALMGGVNPAYIARQLGHENTKMLFEKYAKWIDGADKGVERRVLEAAFGANSSQIRPNMPVVNDNSLNNQNNSGRRDWTRTNDPHHVKVVL